MEIIVDDLTGREIADFLEQHIQDMKSVSPPESKHALDIEALKSKDVTFWSVYDEGQLVGCGAIKELSTKHGEIKSMRRSKISRGKGIASMLLRHIIAEANNRGYSKISLETGVMPFFQPAHRLYRKFGFTECPPFSDYSEDPNSLFMAKKL